MEDRWYSLIDAGFVASDQNLVDLVVRIDEASRILQTSDQQFSC